MSEKASELPSLLARLSLSLRILATDEKLQSYFPISRTLKEGREKSVDRTMTHQGLSVESISEIMVDRAADVCPSFIITAATAERTLLPGYCG